MLHKNPLIAFKRLGRLYGGMCLAVVSSHLIDASAWFACGVLTGMAMMLSVILPLHRETTRALDAAELSKGISHLLDPHL